MLRAWCKTNSFNNARNLSHVLMDGGVLSIPFDKLRDFYEVYIKSIKADEKVFVVEQKTDTYNFFMDVDYKDDESLSLDQVKSICQIICDKVDTFHSTKCLISVGEPKPKDGQIKTGIHLNWPGLVVNQMGAIQLMHHVVHTLEKIYSAKDWTKIIDSSVYGSVGTKGSGFRLPWSHKKTQHSECKGVGCTNCDGGKFIEGEYLTVFTCSDGHMESINQEITMEKLLASTVRTSETTIIEIPELVILCQPIPKKFHREGDFTNVESKDEINDIELLTLLETFIRKNMDGNEDIRVLKIFKYKNIHLLKTTSRYCENIKRNHNSNHIKLIIDNRFIYQKCFCRCDTIEGRQLGTCKDFSGRKHKLETNGGRRICEILYPNKKI
jgi:hypothetical protein